MRFFRNARWVRWVGWAALPLLWACGNFIEDTPEPSNPVAKAKLEAPPDPASRPPSSRVNPDQCPEIDRPDGQELRALRDTGQYAELEARIVAVDQAYSKNVYCETLVWMAYTELTESGDRTLVQLDRWVAARPGSPEPFVARSQWRMNAGYAARGNKLAKDTPQENFERMRESFALAVADFTAAKELGSMHMVSVGAVVKVNQANGGREGAEKIVDAYLEQDPLNYGVRRRLVEAHSPRWGGSRKDVKRIARKAQAYTNRNFRLRVLMGFHHAYTAETAYYAKNYDLAIEEYSKALEYGDYGTLWARKRARSYGYKRRHFGHAFADVQYAKRSVPNDAATWRTGGWLHSLRREWLPAIAEYDRAIEISPQWAQARRGRAWAHKALGNWEQAVEDLRTALELAPDAWAASQLGQILLENLNRPSEAIEPLRRATEMKPNDRDHWFYLARAQEENGDPAAAESYRRFVALASDSHDRSRVKIARLYLDPSLRAGAASEDGQNRMPGMSLLEH